MTAVEAPPGGATDIQTFVRNRYFYGKLLDVFHFDLEQKYFNDKRWLLNRLVTGYGVVCGLNVQLTDDHQNIQVYPGVAIDKAGREIVVPAPSKPVAIPDAPKPPETPPKDAKEEDDCEDQSYGHVCICYHECAGDPEPVRAGDCDAPAEPCAPGSIRERYTVSIQPRRAHKIHMPPVDDLIANGRVNYEALTNHVTKDCAKLPSNPCIPLANVRLPQAGQKAADDSIDITVRPIVFTNDLLYELLQAFMMQSSNRPRTAK
jgi:hypothetical protein